MSNVVETILSKYNDYDFTKDFREFEKYGKHKGKFNNNLIYSLGLFFNIDKDDLQTIIKNSYNGLVSIQEREFGIIRLCISDKKLLKRLDNVGIHYKLMDCYTNVYSVVTNYYDNLLELFEIE